MFFSQEPGWQAWEVAACLSCLSAPCGVWESLLGVPETLPEEQRSVLGWRRAACSTGLGGHWGCAQDVPSGGQKQADTYLGLR